MASTFTWLHLTDLHIGQPRHQHSPEQIRAMLVRDLQELIADRKLEPPDIVFFTGDLAYSGTEAQYVQLEKFLGDLWQAFKERGWKPLLAPVPGNHDLSWQELTLDQRALWRTFHDPDGEVRDQFFESRSSRMLPDAPSREGYWLNAGVEKAFQGYVDWLNRTKIPLVARTPGLP